MTTTTEGTSRELHLGHPVRSFVLVLMAIAVGLVVLQLSGAAMPLVTNFEGQGGGGDYGGGRNDWSVVIRNDGLLPVRVESLSWPTSKATNVRVDVLPRGVDVPGPPLPPPAGDVPFTLDRGEKRVVVVSGETPCPVLMAGALRMVVRPALGINRRVVVEGTDSLDFGPCP